MNMMGGGERPVVSPSRGGVEILDIREQDQRLESNAEREVRGAGKGAPGG